MGSVADALRGAVSAEDLAELQESIDGKQYDNRREDVAADGAISLTVKTSLISVDGTMAFTLADGEEGQIKVFLCVAVANTPVGVITPDNFGNGSNITLNAVGETITLEFRDGAWWATAVSGATIA